MKKLLGVLLITVLSFNANAQNVLKVMMDDRSEITVSINGRDYNRVGRELTFIDMPAGWHDIRVYRYIPYREGGGRAKLVYSSRIRLKRGTTAICTVDGTRGRMRVKYLDINATVNQTLTSDTATQNHTVVKEVLTDEELQEWQKKVETIPTDIEKKRALEEALSDMDFTTAQVKKMLNWFAFESSKLEFAKWCHGKVRDAHQYKTLIEVFELEESKEELKQLAGAK